MRRTGSASCLLKPKKTLSQHDLQLLHDKAPTATVLTVNRLPPYVTDRLYMLSELQVHSHSIQFLCDLKKNATKMPSLPSSIILYMRWKPGTYPTPLSFADGPLSECVRQCLIANGEDAPLDELELVRSRPRETPYSPRRQQPYDELPTQTVESLKKMSLPLLGSNGASTSKPTDSIETKNDEEDEINQLTNIYVVIDRISPESNSDNLPDLPDLSCTSYESIRRGEQGESSTQTISSTNHQQQSHKQPQSDKQKELEQINQHNNEMKVVKALARAVTSSRFLRNRIDGLTIGVTSDARAAPGLEACMDTVARGAKERRRASSSKPAERAEERGGRERSLRIIREKSPERSPIAIVACEPDDLESDHEHSHHHHHHHDTDASNKILQSRIITEWNGKGDCETFVDRAMSDWRQAWSVSSGADKGNPNSGNYQGKTRPKVPRIRKEDESEYEEEYAIDEPVSTLMIIVLLGGILAYLWNLYGDVIHSLLIGEN